MRLIRFLSFRLWCYRQEQRAKKFLRCCKWEEQFPATDEVESFLGQFE